VADPAHGQQPLDAELVGPGPLHDSLLLLADRFVFRDDGGQGLGRDLQDPCSSPWTMSPGSTVMPATWTRATHVARREPFIYGRRRGTGQRPWDGCK
jgi:hypothetical protein